MFLVAVRCHCLTFLLAGSQVIPSHFAATRLPGTAFGLSACVLVMMQAVGFALH